VALAGCRNKKSNAENAPVEIRINTTDDRPHFEIQDHGQVIPEETGLALDLIFETFYSNDKSSNKKTGGYGLKLSLCKTIFEVQCGTISVKSNFGVGVTFCLNLSDSPQPI
jgi:signal transduction histidine kinase